VTSWHGHRQDADLPDPVQKVWQEKFARAHSRPQPGNRGRQTQSNVDIALLDPEGNVVHWFDGFSQQGGSPQALAQNTLRQLQTAADRLDLPASPKKVRAVTLPPLEAGQGVRAIVTLHDQLMRAYSAPVVENVPLSDADWAPLAYVNKAKTIDAALLDAWLAQIYPPGVMQRTDPVSKEAYRIERVEGTLTLTPAGTKGKHRFMLLSGTIRLHDEGDDDFSFTGKLNVVLGYPKGSDRVAALRGVFAGIYPRYDRMHRKMRNIPLTAVFESITADR
jgi:hypothetical protein